MSKNVLMIYPEIPTTYWSFTYALPFIGKRASIPPLGLMTVASLLPDDYEVKLIDMNVSGLSREDIMQADMVFISAMIVQKRSFEEVVEICNDCGKTVVAGGPYPTSSYEKIKGVDHFVLNEAELTLPVFIQDYERGNPKGVYRSEMKPDITKTPPPRFDLVTIDAYSNMALQFSRGCPFNCEFCDIIEMFGRFPRTKNPEQLIREMELVLESGFRGSLFIVDDNFVGNKKKVKELLPVIIEWQKKEGYPFKLFTEASINLADDNELLDMMVAAGFDMVFVGIETPDEKTLALTQKKQNLRNKILDSIIKIQEKGIEVSAGFILGFDTDPDDIFERQIRLIQEAGIPMAMVGLLIALPNTQLFRRLEKEGRLLGQTSGCNTQDFKINFIPVMPEERLIEGYRRVLSEIYSPGKYFARCLKLLERMPRKRTVRRAIKVIELRAFLLSLFRQSLSKYGFQYLKFLIMTLRHNIHQFPLAVSLAVKGYHFFRITEETLKANELSSMMDYYMKSLDVKLMEIVEMGNTLCASKLDEWRFVLRKNIAKKYRQLDRGMQQYVNDKLIDFQAYSEYVISYWKESVCNQLKTDNTQELLLELPRKLRETANEGSDDSRN